MTIERNVVSGDTSVNRSTSRGTHTASGRSYEVLGEDAVPRHDRQAGSAGGAAGT